MKLADDLINSIAEQVAMPEVYHNIRALIVKPDSIIDDYARVINADPALAARIVKIANSQFFGYSRKTVSVEQAVSLIGVMQLHDLLLSCLAIRAFSGIPDSIINLSAFWRSCIYCGIVARLLAKKCRLPASERLFTSGLLHEIGHVVMYTKIPELAQQILLESEQTAEPVFKREREILGFDYAQLGRELMQLWHLPESYQTITEFHLEPEKATRFQVETAIVHLARHIVLAEEPDGEAGNKQPAVSPEIWQMTLLTENIADEVQSIAKLHVDEVMDSLWPFTLPVIQDSMIVE